MEAIYFEIAGQIFVEKDVFESRNIQRISQVLVNPSFNLFTQVPLRACH